jgi:hypothetical protein
LLGTCPSRKSSAETEIARKPACTTPIRERERNRGDERDEGDDRDGDDIETSEPRKRRRSSSVHRA